MDTPRFEILILASCQKTQTKQVGEERKMFVYHEYEALCLIYCRQIYVIFLYFHLGAKNINMCSSYFGSFSTNRIKATNTFPYRSSLICPTPRMSLNWSKVTGFFSTMSSKESSEKMI